MRTPCSHVFLGALLLSLGATTGHAGTVVVAPDGSGDFTAIQPAIDWLFAHRTLGDPDVPPDTAIVHAGYYDETIQSHVDDWITVLRIECPSGPSLTRVRTLNYPAGSAFAGIAAEVSGLGIQNRVEAGSEPIGYSFAGCALEGGFMQDVGNVWMTDCVVGGRSQFVSPGAYLSGTTFVSAPVRFTGAEDITWFTIANCSFYGPADTLVTVEPDGYPGIWFENCAFHTGGIGLCKGRVGGTVTTRDEIRVQGCQFSNLTVAAIQSDLSPLGLRRYPGIAVHESRITACARALDWRGAGQVRMQGDTLQGVGYPAIRARTARVELQDLVMSPGTGGLDVHLELANGDFGLLSPGSLEIRRCSMSGLPGPAITVVDSLTPTSVFTRNIRDNVVRNCAGDGITVSSAGVTLQRNVVSACTGAGLRVEMLGASLAFRVESNTLAGNQGDGLVFTNPNLVVTPRRIAQRNLSAFNHGAGLRLNGVLPGSTAFNDAWQNDGGNYLGIASPLDSNLVADPLFCDRASGDFRLAFGSPCGAGGTYGLIGALPEACQAHAGAPLAAPVAFSLHPSPARGAVWFTPPSTGADGDFEVLDVQGRRLWSKPFRAGGAPVVWRGESALGAATPGLYWVRLSRVGESATRRLIWLK